jgi:PiT family inorganic phosphate transporter
MIAGLVVAGAIAVAAANGANDNFKGVATLFGSRAASYRSSLSWGTLTTLAGSLAAVFLGSRLAAAFSGGGLLPAGVVAMPVLLGAVAVGAALTVGLAARAGLPISTTHALLGALLGAGGIAAGGHLDLRVLVQRFVAPLLISPAAAFAVAAITYPVLGRVRASLGVRASSCVCLAAAGDAVPAAGGTLAMRSLPVLHACDRRYEGEVLGVSAQQVVAGAHFVSAGLQSFARGLNDTPKIAALLLGASLAGQRPSPAMASVVVAASMTIGGWFGARRVGETMSHRITTLGDGQALTTNAVTAGLVLAASAFALPVSMTHVGVGSLAGLGWSTGQARWSTLRTIALSWVLTLPLAAVLGAIIFALAERISS